MTGGGDSRARIQLRQLGVIMLAACVVTPVFNVLTSAPTLRSAIQGVVDGVLVTALVGTCSSSGTAPCAPGSGGAASRRISPSAAPWWWRCSWSGGASGRW